MGKNVTMMNFGGNYFSLSLDVDLYCQQND